MNNWDVFLEKLNSENNFNQQLREYLSAIKYISEINVEKIDDSKVREEINEKLDIIVKFIQTYGTDYYEIGLIKGFKINKKIDDHWSIDGRDYYYYIADQKMKASVYYVRYLNFINKYLTENTSAERELMGYISDIHSKLEREIEITKDNIIGVIDDELDKTEYSLKLRKKCIDCIEQIRTNDISYLEYMLFNNMMREIRYIGAAYQYLWHWETKTKNLFRYVSYDGEELNIIPNYNKKSFLENMFNSVISHMNKSSRKLCSYSEDPYVDIFKYLKILKSGNNNFGDNISSIPHINIKIQNLENDNKAQFEILRGIDVNSIYRNGFPNSFYGFVQDGKALNDTDKLAYAVELYPDLPGQDKNSKNTTKNIKDLLFAYLKTWADRENINKLMSYVADDKEVVTYGRVNQNELDINNDIPEKLCNSCRYKMTLNKKELLYLLLKIRNNHIDEIVQNIDIKLNMYGKEMWIGQAIKKDTSENCVIDGQIFIQIAAKSSKSIKIRIEITPAITIVGDKNLTIDGYKKKIQETVKEQIQQYFKDRYNDILKEQYNIADFIIKFIDSEGHKCPSYIAEYNEYEPENGDEEISILKYIVFKR